jgi:iron complex outermembrane receptor protein
MVKNTIFLAMCWLLLAQAETQAAQELNEADFLADMPTVLTSSRLEQPQMDAPNSITVIDRKTIEASGYHNISDLFRLVPGMYVGQKSGWSQSVSLTFADEFARRMQVMVDGRSVYLPTIGGVRWDTLPLAIDDIDHIEVVRGPNAASYGANAMTGIINIITRNPEDVAGRMVHVEMGDHGHREGWFRWAGSTENSSQRLTLGRREDGGLTYQFDDERSNILNYRGDFKPDAHQQFSLQFGLVDGQRGTGSLDDARNQPHQQAVGSQYFQADYQREMDAGGSLQAKLYFNRLHTQEDVPVSLVPGAYYVSDLLAERLHAEVQLDTDLAPGVRSVLGGYLRRDSVQSYLYWNTNDKISADSWGVFGHLEWRLADQWLVNAGGFLEDYDLVGTRFSPRVTLHWQPSTHHAFRVGIARAYRNPVLFESSGNAYIHVLNAAGSPLANVPYIVASGNVRPEDILSKEIGYLGVWPEQGLTLDVRLFHERIGNYIGFESPSGHSGECPVSSTSALPGARDMCNLGGATQHGLEAQIKWQASENTQILANYAFLHIDSEFNEPRYSPPNISGLHLMHRFPGEIDMTLANYWVSAFEPISQHSVPAYQRLDARLAKHFKLDGNRGTVALVWQDLSGSYYELGGVAGDHPSLDNLFDKHFYVQFQLDF